MLLRLTIEDAAAYIHIWGRKQPGIMLRGTPSASGRRIVYRIRSRRHKSQAFEVLLHRIRASATEVTFPTRIQETAVFPSPRPDGGTIEVTPGAAYEPVFRNRLEEQQYKLCHSIWNTLKLHEYLLERRLGVLDTESRKELQKPSPGSPLEDWFAYKLLCDQQGVTYTLRELAAEAGKSYGTIRNRYPNWRREHPLE